MMATRISLVGLLVIVFLANFVETAAEDWVRDNLELGRQVEEMGNSFAIASHSLEGNFSFEHHDAISKISVYGYSLSYFFLLPILGLAVGIALARRSDIQAFRVFSLALAFNYLLSLPFFLFMPVPERWYYSGSDAMLLSDLWNTNLIEWLRPISGLDNSFPSTHVSFTVIIILVCFLFGVRMRYSMSALGLTIILSTYVLGIHWIADMIAGIGIAILSVALAHRYSLSLDEKVKLNSPLSRAPSET